MTRELRNYIEYKVKTHVKKTDQIYHTKFLETFGGLSLHAKDTKKRYTTDQEDVNFVKNYGSVSIGNIDELDSYQPTMSIFTSMIICLIEF